MGYKALDNVLKICDYGIFTIVEMSFVMDESTPAIRKIEDKAIKKLRSPKNGKLLKKYLLEKIEHTNKLTHTS